jgi:hypothetical protein
MNETVVGRFFAEWILQKELNGSGGRRPMSVRRLCDLKVNRTVAARAPGDNDLTFNDILYKSASCNYASKEVSCQSQGEGQRGWSVLLTPSHQRPVSRP